MIRGIKVAGTQNCVHALRKYLWHRNPQKPSGYCFYGDKKRRVKQVLILFLLAAKFKTSVLVTSGAAPLGNTANRESIIIFDLFTKSKSHRGMSTTVILTV